MEKIVTLSKFERALGEAKTTKETLELEAIAKAMHRAALSLANEDLKYFQSMKWLLQHIKTRLKTTELLMPYAPENGKNRFSSTTEPTKVSWGRKKADLDPEAEIQMTYDEWTHRKYEFGLGLQRIQQEHDNCIAKGIYLSLPILWKIAGMPHVSHNSGENEWYTPSEYVRAAKSVLGEIDLDPASSKRANKTVGAKKYFTKEDDGLIQDWLGRVWLNPPYATELIGPFIEKYVGEIQSGRVTEGIVLVNNATETIWFKELVDISSAIAFPTGRIRFLDAKNNPSGEPLQGQAIAYAGPNGEKFLSEFGKFGWGARIAK